MGGILKQGQHCWRSEPADRVAFLIDGEDYFRSVREAILKARSTIIIIGWDIHSRLQLVRDNKQHDYPTRLGDLLNYVAKHHKVNVYVLTWDFAVIYAMERESFPLYKMDWKTHRRLHFHMDDHHPMGASHHQKMVVVDDMVAFAGGFDLSVWRWDSRDHNPNDPRRVDTDGKPYGPFHDVQMVVQGQAAQALGELARERWVRARGKHIKTNNQQGTSPWPESIPPDMQQVQVSIARTLPAYQGYQEVREVEAAYLESIKAAKQTIYIENQYLSSHAIADALIERLTEDLGPEIVIVLPQKTGGWLEQHTMDVLRGRLVTRLRQVDKHNRLRIYYPQLTDDENNTLMVHAKIMVVDDNMLRIGSSNLSNRSMGLDSECDLLIEAQDDSQRANIAHFRHDLLAEHLSCSIEQVEHAYAQNHSLIQTIEELATQQRRLVTLSGEVPDEIDRQVPDSALLDPERPMQADDVVNYFVPHDEQKPAYKRVVAVVLILSVLLALTAAWRWTPLNEWLDVDQLVASAKQLNQYRLAPLYIIPLFALAATLAIPLTLLVIAAVIAFGSWWGFGYALTGALLSALIGYSIGRGMGRDLVRRIAGKRLNALSKKLSKRGILAVLTVRIIPVAPFAMINLVAGASHIRLRDFFIGSLIGFLPGFLAIAVFADRLAASLEQPDMGSMMTLVAVVGAIILLIIWLRKWLDQKSDQSVTA